MSAASSSPERVRRVLQRQIMPVDRDLDVLPLYVDPDPAVLDADKYNVGGDKGAKELNKASLRQSVSSGSTVNPDQIVDRHSIRIKHGERLSFGSYFNAFPASYWRRWSIVEDVRLTVELAGSGASVTVYRSMANGRSQRVDSCQVEDDATSGTFEFELPLQPFADGGWYWYDVTAGDDDAVVTAVWDAEVPADRAEAGTVTIAITTMNRPDFCAKLVGQLGEDPAVLGLLDEVLVMEQGTQKVVDSEEFPAAEKSLQGKLRIIEQGNLGGSGGYARGQLEAVRAAVSTYVLCMDDDVVCEPEGILRAVTFGDLARRPTIVGGHMFSLYSRSRLHSFGEIIQSWRWWWMSPEHVLPEWDFAARNLRSTRWLHRRVDVDFNGWFMCLIPRVVLEDVGLSLPLFIKWDDSEFGVRAKHAGYPTVTFPGAAVWHVPWTDKNDALDWQAYFHQRNRLIAALLHSPYPHGGRVIRESVNHTIAHLVGMQYSTVELRQLAIEDVLAGPDGLHAQLPTRLAEVNAFRKQYSDAQLSSDPDAFPPVRRAKPSRRGHEELEVPSRRSQLITAGLMPLRQLRRPRPLSREFPEAEVAAMDARWYRLARYDSAVVSMPDQTSAALYTRDPELYRDLLKRVADLHLKLYRRWPELAAEYRSKLPEITSPEAWEETFRPWTDAEADSGAEAAMTDVTDSAAAVAPREARHVDAPLRSPAAGTGLLEVFRRRYLLRLLVRREISARYQGSVLGLLWSYINPLSQFFIYYVVMGVLFGLHKDVQNFAIHMFCGIIIVHFFNETFNAGTRSIVRNKALVQKMAMPREMFPVASMLVSGYHVVPQVVIMVVVCVLLGWTPTVVGMAALLTALFIIMVSGTAMALLFSAANVFFRDVSNVASIMTNFVRFGVPMIYPYTMVQDRFGEFAQYYLLNPIADAVLLFQQAFWVGTTSDPTATAAKHLPANLWAFSAIAVLMSVILLGIGQLVFSRLENKIPERL